jgi:hypothetical protein
MAIEAGAGVPAQQARANALAALAARDATLASIHLPEPPTMAADELARRIEQLVALLEGEAA